jgi:hypothetical protein
MQRRSQEAKHRTNKELDSILSARVAIVSRSEQQTTAGGDVPAPDPEANGGEDGDERTDGCDALAMPSKESHWEAESRGSFDRCL